MRLKNSLLVFACALFAFTSCEQKQSQLDLDNLENRVTITGTATYDAGAVYSQTNGYEVRLHQPVVGKKVFIDVPYNAYNINNQGVKTFETITDENGCFAIEIPTTPTGIGTINSPVVLRLEEFTAVYNEFVKMQDGSPIFKQQIYKYSHSQNLIALKAGAFEFPEMIEYNKEAIDLGPFDNSISLIGNIQIAQESGFREGKFVAASRSNVEFEIEYNDIDSDPSTPGIQNLILTYGATTDSVGAYRLVIPAQNHKEAFRVNRIAIQGVGESNYTHYKSPTESIALKGVYQSRDKNTTMGIVDAIDGIDYNMGTTYLLFTPNFDGGITIDGSVNVPSWRDNLVGWSKATTNAIGMEDMVNINGKISLATSTAYGIGSYENKVQSIRVTIPWIGGREFIAATKADGTFSIDIPIMDATVVPAALPTIALDNTMPEVTHYYKDGTSIVLKEGNYVLYGGASIRTEGSTWNMLGDYYYTFNPTTRPEDWSNNLAGWVKLDDYTTTTNVSGKVYIPFESAYGVGEYKKLDNQLVTIIIGYPTMAPIRVDALVVDGEFNVEIPSKKDGGTYTANFVAATEIDEFKYQNFYLNETSLSAEVKNLTGVYNNPTIIKDKDAKWNDIGSVYYTFTPDNDPTTNNTPETFHPNLAGWVKKADHNNTATITGRVLWSLERSYGVGEYVAASNQIISIKVGDTYYETVVGPNGQYSLVVPTKYQGEEFNVDEAVINQNGIKVNQRISTTKFTHYTKDGSNLLEGTFTKKTTKRDVNAKWNDRGTTYLSFTPKNAPLTWNQNLIGWVTPKENFDGKVTLTGRVLLAKEEGLAKGTYSPAKGLSATIAVDYGTEVVRYSILLNNNGGFNISVPVPDETQSYTATIENLFTEDEYLHYYQLNGATKTSRLKGKYQTRKHVIRPEGAEWYQLGDIYYAFTPDNLPNSWHADLIGWFKTNYTNSATVTGRAYMAKETSYGVGEYLPAAGEIIKLNITDYYDYPVSLEVLTDENGNISAEIPIENVGDVCNVNMSGAVIRVNNFEHYAAAGAAPTLIDGNYSATAIRDGSATWSSLGDIYYRFTPNNPASVLNWNRYFQYLAGWQKDPERLATINVTGAVKLPIESAFRTGSYIPGANQLVKVLVDHDNNAYTADIPFVGVTNQDGIFTIPVYARTAQDILSVTWANEYLVPNVKNESGLYTHYTGPNKSTKIRVQYATYITSKRGSEKFNEMGTRYYKAVDYNNPLTQPTDVASTWTYNLAGWHANASSNNIATYKVTGSVKKAIEKFDAGTWRASWAGDGSREVDIEISISSSIKLKFRAVTNNAGIYNLSFAYNKDVIEGNTFGFKVTPITNSTKYAFSHATDMAENRQITIYGKYETAYPAVVNITENNGTFILTDTDGGTAPSAKVLFTPESTPEGWGSYNWASILSSED